MRKRLWVACAASVIALAVAAAPAVAAVTRTWLSASRTQGYYGQDIALQPSVDTTMAPGDKFEFQRYDVATSAWVKLDEQTIEETDSVDPLYLGVGDPELPLPMTVRSIFHKGGSVLAADPVSAEVYLAALKYKQVKTAITAPKTVKKGKSFTVEVAVSPNPGPGVVEVKIARRKWGSKYETRKTVKVMLDEGGEGSLTFKPATKATYRISARFLGNDFGPKSATVKKSFRAK